MVKFSGTTEGGGRLIGIGLSRRNCELLLAGQPISFSLRELGLRVVDANGQIVAGHVLVLGGATEADIMAEAQQAAEAAGVPVDPLEERIKPSDG